MKKDIHPTNYRPVAFQDLNDGSTFITRSTVDSEEKITLEGVEYPLIKVHISSSSHPYFTGEERIVDIEGRVDKFKARQEAAQKAKANKAAKATSQKLKAKSPKLKKPKAQKLGAEAPATEALPTGRQAAEQ